MKMKIIAGLASAFFLTTTVFSQEYLLQVKPVGSKTWGYANEKGEIVIKPQFEKCHKFSAEGLAPIYDQKAKQYYFINTKGERVTTEVKDFKLIDRFGFDLEGFTDGLIPIKQGEKWGFLNSEGKVAIPAKYDKVTGFSDGHAVAVLNEKQFILNTSGEESAVEGSGTLEVREFHDGLAPIRAADKKFGYVDASGKVVIKPQFESVGYFADGLAWAETADKKVGFIDKTGAWVIKPIFSVAKEIDPSTGFARVKTGDDWGYVNKSGDMLSVKDSEYWGDFSDGLAAGKKDGKVGFFNSKGEWVIQPQFEGTRGFKNGYAAVEKDKNWGTIDTSGNWVIKPTFDRVMDVEVVK